MSRASRGAAKPRSRKSGQTGGYVLRLYMTGTRSRSLRALENIKKICEQFVPGGYELEVVDLYQQPAMAAEEQIIAAPTVVRRRPLPVRRVIGDMSNAQRVLDGLDLHSAPPEL